MVHELSQYRDTLPKVDDWIAGDRRVLALQVVDDNGDGVDIESATVAWELFEKPYHTADSEVVLDGDDAGVELVTDSRVDTSNGQWEVRLDGDVTDDLYGTYWHRPVVTDANGERASWIGEIVFRVG